MVAQPSIEAAFRSYGLAPLDVGRWRSGPLTVPPGVTLYGALRPPRLLTAFVNLAGKDASADEWLERFSLQAFGYDLNRDNVLATLQGVAELHVWSTALGALVKDRLAAWAHGHDGHSYWHEEAGRPLPVLPEGYEGQIYPTLGWVSLPDQPEQDVQVWGFYAMPLPEGMIANHTGRGYGFVSEGFEPRPVRVCRMVMVLDPDATATETMALVQKGLNWLFTA